MSFAERWLRRPQNTGLYKAIFQIHLWAGICLGLYIVVVCASGSALVFRNDIYDIFEGWTRAGPSSAQVRLMKEGYRALEWLGRLHGNLLLGPNGLMANAIAGFLVSAVCLTGLVVWWPGIETWRRGLGIRRHVGWKRFVYDLHKAVGVWSFVILFMWGMTGGYFVFPQPFRAVINSFTPVDPPLLPARPRVAAGSPGSTSAATATPAQPAPRTGRRRRPLTRGGKILQGFSAAHYGNFAGWPVKTLWFLMGLVPLLLVPTSLLMWWNRVIHPALLRRRRQLSAWAGVELQRK